MAVEYTYTPDRPTLAEQLAALKVGDTLQLPKALVRRVRTREYVLHAENNRERARWGTVTEIEADIRVFLETGFLPKAQGGHW